MPIQTRGMLNRERGPLRDLDLRGEEADDASVVCLGVVEADTAVKKRKTDENAHVLLTNRQRHEYSHEDYMQETVRSWLAREIRLPPYIGNYEIKSSDREHYVVVGISTSYTLKSRDESLHTGIRLADRYLALAPETDLDDLKAVVLTGLWMGVKFHENSNDIPSVAVFVQVGARFTKNHFVSLETQMLKALEYDVSGPTTAEFLRVLNTLKPPQLRTTQQISLASFLADASLIIYELASVKPSLLALVIVALARGSSYRTFLPNPKTRPFFLSAQPDNILPLMNHTRQDLYLPAIVLVDGLNRVMTSGLLDFMITHHKLKDRHYVSELMLAGLSLLRTAT